MQTPKSRSSSSETPQKISPRAARKLKPTALQVDSASSSNQASKAAKERSPKVLERKSPRSPVPEKKRPSRIPELESQISQLQDDLNKAKEQLVSSQSWKTQAEQDKEESNKQLLALSSKLEESQRQLLQLSTSEQARFIEFQKLSHERDEAWQSELEAIQKKHTVDSATLAFALNLIQQLKVQLDMVSAETGAVKSKHTESAKEEFQQLDGTLVETLSLLNNMKNELNKPQAETLISNTLLQLETAKNTVESLLSDGVKATETYNSIALELDESKSRLNLLEGLVKKLRSGVVEQNEVQIVDCQNTTEFLSLKSEVERLKSALEIAETKYNEVRIRSAVQIRSVYEQVDEIKSGTSLRESELRKELEISKAYIEELKANLMDKENELQGISEENEGLNLRLKKIPSSEREFELENEVKKLNEQLAGLKVNFMDKETELQCVAEENGMLKLEIDNRKLMKGRSKDVIVEVETAWAAAREAQMKLGIVVEEVDKSDKRLALVTEQLEAAKAANSEMEAELRRVKVQSEQWRKAAEAAATMLSSAGNNGKFMERSGSLDNNYNSPVMGKMSSPYPEEIIDDDLLKKKNGNMLKKIGVLWKKQQK